MHDVENFPFQPVIIIGAGRSGTNILRDTLCALPDFATWDCDEINPIWKHGNIGARNDEFSPAMATGKIRNFVRQQFLKQWHKHENPRFLVEKTCANSLRVDFVAEILPEARFLFLVRNGIDVVASAEKRWRGEMELDPLPYYWSKIRNTPLMDLPVYLWRFIGTRLGMIMRQKQHMSFWGPQFSNLEHIRKNTSLLELCALQWKSCVEKSHGAFAKMPNDKFLEIRYEQFTTRPQQQMERMLKFLNADVTSDELAKAVEPISKKSVGKGQSSLGGEAGKLIAIMKPALEKFQYEVGDA